MKIKKHETTEFENLKSGDVFRGADGYLYMKTDGVRDYDEDYYDAVRLEDGYSSCEFKDDTLVEPVHGAFAEGES